MKKVILISIVAGTALFANALDAVKDVAVQQAATKAVETVVETVSEKAPVEEAASEVVEAASSAEEMDKAAASAHDMETAPAAVPEVNQPEIKVIDAVPESVSELKDKAVDTAKKVVTEKVMDAVAK